MILSNPTTAWPPPTLAESGYRERATKTPCTGCGKPIAGGQLYTVRTNTHLGCGAKA